MASTLNVWWGASRFREKLLYKSDKERATRVLHAIVYSVYLFLGPLMMVVGMYWFSHVVKGSASDFVATMTVWTGLLLLGLGVLAIYASLKRSFVLQLAAHLVHVFLFIFLVAAMMIVIACVDFNLTMPTCLDEDTMIYYVAKLWSVFVQTKTANNVDAVDGIINGDGWKGEYLLSEQVRGTSEQVRDARMLEFLQPFMGLYVRPKSTTLDATTCLLI